MSEKNKKRADAWEERQAHPTLAAKGINACWEKAKSRHNSVYREEELEFVSQKNTAELVFRSSEEIGSG